MNGFLNKLKAIAYVSSFIILSYGCKRSTPDQVYYTPQLLNHGDEFTVHREWSKSCFVIVYKMDTKQFEEYCRQFHLISHHIVATTTIYIPKMNSVTIKKGFRIEELIVGMGNYKIECFALYDEGGKTLYIKSKEKYWR